MEDAIRKADILIDAIPYIRNFRSKTFVIKYGGSILFEESIRKSVLEDIVFLYFMGVNVVLVHGGGPNITERLKDLNIKSEFHEGIRVTDENTLKVVEEELVKLNKIIVEGIQNLGAKAIGLNGKDDLIYAEKKKSKQELGFVGQVVNLNLDKFSRFIKENHIVAITPMGRDSQGIVYNINADEAASFISSKLSAEKLVLLTDVRGVMRNPEDKDSLISSITEKQAKQLIRDGVISTGMIPKVLAGVSAIEQGSKKAHIIDAKIPHALLLEIFTQEGIGTEIIK